MNISQLSVWNCDAALKRPGTGSGLAMITKKRKRKYLEHEAGLPRKVSTFGDASQDRQHSQYGMRAAASHLRHFCFLRPHRATPLHLRPPRPHHRRFRLLTGLVTRGCVLSTRGGGRTFARRRKSCERSRWRSPRCPRLRGGNANAYSPTSLPCPHVSHRTRCSSVGTSKDCIAAPGTASTMEKASSQKPYPHH